MTYPRGTVSTLAAENPGLAEQFRQIFPDRPVPADIPVHPAPVYETLAALAIFALLWSLRKRPMAAGMLFGIYLVLAGLERLLVEFIRLNPLYLGLSQAQWISIGMIVLGAMLYWTLRTRPADTFEESAGAVRRAAAPRPRAAR
jgi:prolipoprotein diacylglyceryltransferase